MGGEELPDGQQEVQEVRFVCEPVLETFDYPSDPGYRRCSEEMCRRGSKAREDQAEISKNLRHTTICQAGRNEADNFAVRP